MTNKKARMAEFHDAQSEYTDIIKDKPEEVKMRSVEEVRKELARLEAAMLKTIPEDKFMWWQRLWAMKWFLCESEDD